MILILDWVSQLSDTVCDINLHTPGHGRAIFGPDPLRGYRVLRSLVAPSQHEFVFPASNTVEAGGGHGPEGSGTRGGSGGSGGAGSRVSPFSGHASSGNVNDSDDVDEPERVTRDKDSVITYSEVISVFGPKPVTITVWGYLIAADAGVAGMLNGR